MDVYPNNEIIVALQQNGIDTSSFQRIYENNNEILNALTAQGDHAIDLWIKLRNISAQTGCWPVVLGNDKDLNFLRTMLPSYSALEIEGVIQDGIRMKPTAIVHDEQNIHPFIRLKEYVTDSAYKDHQRARTARIKSNALGVQTVAVAPNSIDVYDSSITRNLIPNTASRVYVGLIPTTHSWQVPAYLRFGNWNDCPSPAVHVCMMKHWHDLYGSVIVGISHDVVETLVERHPARDADALALAFEQYQYCSDIVNQGTGTIYKLSQSLKTLSNWYFWWD